MTDIRLPLFSDTLRQQGNVPAPDPPAILQINMGKLCNQSCSHCHVDAGPDRKEIMSRETMEICLDILRRHPIGTVDLTGGAPELNPDFRWFVAACADMGKKVMHRCNLTVLVSHKRFSDLPGFFAGHQVHIISSLPHYNRYRTDSQRGEGVFEDSIAALRLLNETGYGIPGSPLTIDLVYNPSGAFLPGGQAGLEAEFRKQLLQKFDVHFNHLLTITNMPISRFLEYLLESGNYVSYMEKLVEAFNPTTIPGLMCRNTLSVGWDGYLYDCDFNQMLDLPVASSSRHIRDFDYEALINRPIVFDQHCYGCTAGSGSSCGGAIA